MSKLPHKVVLVGQERREETNCLVALLPSVSEEEEEEDEVTIVLPLFFCRSFCRSCCPSFFRRSPKLVRLAAEFCDDDDDDDDVVSTLEQKDFIILAPLLFFVVVVKVAAVAVVLIAWLRLKRSKIFVVFVVVVVPEMMLIRIYLFIQRALRLPKKETKKSNKKSRKFVNPKYFFFCFLSPSFPFLSFPFPEKGVHFFYSWRERKSAKTRGWGAASSLATNA